MTERQTHVIVIAFLVAFSVSSSHTADLIGCEPDLPDRLTERCYTVHSEPVSWMTAAELCARDGERLASIPDNATESLLGNFILDEHRNDEDEKVQTVWISGKELVNDSAWRWADGRPFDLITGHKLTVNLSTNMSAYENCAALRFNGTAIVLYSKRCSTMDGLYRCEIAENNDANSTNSSTCLMNGVPGVAIGNKCLVETTSESVPLRASMSWFDGRFHCQMQGAQLITLSQKMIDVGQLGELLVVLNETQTKLASRGVVADFSKISFWLGLYRIPWVWLKELDRENATIRNTEELNYTHWRIPVQPNSIRQNCMALEASMDTYGWADYSCDKNMSYICEKVKIIPKPTTQPTTELTTEPLFDQTERMTSDNTEHSSIVTVVIACIMVGIVLIAVLASAICFCYKKRRGYEEHK